MLVGGKHSNSYSQCMGTVESPIAKLWGILTFWKFYEAHVLLFRKYLHEEHKISSFSSNLNNTTVLQGGVSDFFFFTFPHEMYSKMYSEASLSFKGKSRIPNKATTLRYDQ